MDKDFITEVKEILPKLGITYTEFARYCGVNRASIARLMYLSDQTKLHHKTTYTLIATGLKAVYYELWNMMYLTEDTTFENFDNVLKLTHVTMNELARQLDVSLSALSHRKHRDSFTALYRKAIYYVLLKSAIERRKMIKELLTKHGYTTAD